MILSDFVLQHISITYRIESTLGWQNLISLLTCVSFNCEAQYQGESEEFKEHAFLLVVESQAWQSCDGVIQEMNVMDV